MSGGNRYLFLHCNWRAPWKFECETSFSNFSAGLLTASVFRDESCSQVRDCAALLAPERPGRGAESVSPVGGCLDDRHQSPGVGRQGSNKKGVGTVSPSPATASPDHVLGAGVEQGFSPRRLWLGVADCPPQALPGLLCCTEAEDAAQEPRGIGGGFQLAEAARVRGGVGPGVPTAAAQRGSQCCSLDSRGSRLLLPGACLLRTSHSPSRAQGVSGAGTGV